MWFFERETNRTAESIRRQFSKLRQSIHNSMLIEEETRMRENPMPSEDELFMGAFREWLEPQVRNAIEVMYKKGYATESSGFHAGMPELQIVDGYFTVDDKTKSILEQMGVEVLRGADIGVPRNKLITMLRFRAKDSALARLKDRWDEMATALPHKSFPPGIRPICARAEEFRQKYAPAHPSVEDAQAMYFEYLNRTANQA
jgi:hypothetical protein